MPLFRGQRERSLLVSGTVDGRTHAMLPQLPQEANTQAVTGYPQCPPFFPGLHLPQPSLTL